ncbi:MAG TPA: site-2 protease family protein [Candidatus Paceibacterota bacterium]
MQEINTIFYIVILIMSVIIHEISHGYAAKFLGDNTAEYAGRLTLNPLKHLDPIGSVLVPLILIISKAGFVFGWAKPVPYNEFNLRNRKWGTVVVASAGIISNLTLALLFGLLIRISISMDFASPAFLSISGLIVLVNIVLGIFNLIPIPPLDGSKILFSLLPAGWRRVQIILEQYSLVVLIIFIFFGWQYLSPVIFGLFKFLTGVSF